MWFNSTGVFYYSPKLIGSRNEKWWLVLECDPEIGRFYRNRYNIFRYKTDSLQRPSWKEHITVVRDEEPPNKSFWEKYSGQEVVFSYNPIVENDERYFWLKVECDFLFQVRSELGLLPIPQYPFHLTIGNKI